MRVSIPLVLDGHLLVPADEVSDLLRLIAARWVRATDAGETDLDPETVEVLAGALAEVADQIDVECIAFVPLRDAEDGPPPP
ncbi:DUF6213 family protein [Streptomyces sp. NPDC051183]|uniref:DUF6213 family protein n=1 Tax=unclassified Streptomyces TaxID=2593676 RepID=UPI0034163F1F